MKQIIFGDEARQKLVAGVDKLARAVVTTLGPRGRNVAIDKQWGSPTVLHDGVSVAKEIVLEDPFENMGAQLVKEASSKTNDVAGDGTTTATLLAQQMVQKGMALVKEGANPMQMKGGIDKAVTAVIEELGKFKEDIDEDDWEKVATISAQNPMIGKKIAQAIKMVGKDGIVTVEESNGMDFEIEHKKGMVFDRGFVSPYFSDQQTGEAVVENPRILVTDAKISSLSDIVPALDVIVKDTKDIVIISESLEGEALTMLVVNKMRGNLNVLAVNAPAFGDRRKDALKDIAILTGATYISEDTGRKLDSLTLEDLGRADKVISTKDTTQIIGGIGDITERVEALKTLRENTKSEYDKEQLGERIAKLSSGVAVIKVGASTEVEMNELKERVKDAVGATKAAIDEGIVPGGGVALLRARSTMRGALTNNKDELSGYTLVMSVLEDPIRWLASNSGANPDEVVSTVEKNNDPEFGFNALTLRYENLIQAGVIDPVKVTRSALQNAASVASMILTTDCLITDIKEEAK